VVSQLGGLHWLTAIELARDTPSMFLEMSSATIVFAVRLTISELPERAVQFGCPYVDPSFPE
jgi:hypothetical protein